MTISTTSTVLHDGVRNTTMSFTGVSDGSGNETLVTKVDASELNPPVGHTLNLTKLKVSKISYSVRGGSISLWWNADTPVKFAELSNSDELCYEAIGGRANPNAPGANGDILLSTHGFALDSSYTLDLEMKKS